MITRVEATRYRCFDKLDVEFGEFRVLVGANGSGKTTLLDVPMLFGDLLRERSISTGPRWSSAAKSRAVSTKGCVDPAFQRVRDVLREWFPAEVA